MAKGNKDVKRGIVMYLDGKEVQKNARAIQGEMKRLKKEIDGCTVGSEEYIQKTKQYRALNGILQEHKAQLKNIETQTNANAAASQNWLQKGVAMFNQYSVAILGFTAAFTGVAMKISEFRKKNMEKESSQANLKALTGLDDSSIEWLTKQAEKLSTTMDESGLRVKKSAQEILEAYTMVGSKKPELLQDKEALNAVTIDAMRLAEAAKIDLTDAVAGVTLAMNQYGAAANEASRYVNVLAAGSKMGAVGVATQTESIVKAGVAANVAKVPIEQLVGVLETLGERGIEGSRAGTQLKTFFLKLEAGAEETRPSVVGLQQALETLAKKNLDASEMTKMFGLESYTAAQALISSADKVKYYTDAVTDTNIAVEQAAINSNTMEAKVAQLKNQINETGMALAKDLAPVFSMFTNWATKFVIALPPIVKFIKEYGTELTVVISTLVLYSTWTQIATKATAAWNAVVTFATNFSKTYSAALIQLRLMQSGATASQVAYTRAVASSTVIQRGAIAVTALFRAAMLALKGQTVAATAALNAFKIALASSGAGAAVLVIGALTAVILLLQKKIEKLRDARAKENELNKRVNSEYNEQAAKIKMLQERIHNETLSIQDRQKAIEDMSAIVPGYEAHLDKEGKLYGENTKALDEYLKKLKESITMKAAEGMMEENMKRMLELENEIVEKQKEIERRQRDARNASSVNTGPGAGGASVGYGAMVQKAKSDLEALQKEHDELERRNTELGKKVKEAAKKGGSFGDGGDDGEVEGGGGDTTTTKKTDDRVKKAIAAIELEVKKKQNILRQSYVEGKIDRRKYNAEMQQLEMERLQNILKIAGLEPEKVAEIQEKILEIRIKTKEELDKMSFDMSADEDLKRYHEQTQKIEDELLERISVIDSSLQLGVIAQEDYEAKIAEVWEKYDADMLSAHNAYIKKIRDRKDETKEQLNGLAKTLEEAGIDLKDLAEEIGESIGDGLASSLMGEMDNVKQAFKSMLNLIIDAIEKLVIAAEVEAGVLTATGIGTAAGLHNLAKLVGIKIAFAALKTAVNSFDVGGYTGIGRWDEPAGIVHKGEFVANRHALANPAVKAVLDVVDNAQRKGTVANLTGDDIRAVASHPGTDDGRGRNMETRPEDDRKTRELMTLMRQCIDTMETAKEAYEKPSPSYCWLEGDGGINEKQKLLNKIKSNAKRHG